MRGAGLPDCAAAARLGRTLGAQGFAPIVMIAVQLGSVPVFLAAWGVRSCGTWLLLPAIPAYPSFSDLGFIFVAENELVLAVARAAGDSVRDAINLTLCSTLRISLASAQPDITARPIGELVADDAAEMDDGGEMLGERRGIGPDADRFRGVIVASDHDLDRRRAQAQGAADGGSAVAGSRWRRSRAGARTGPRESSHDKAPP